VEGVQATLVGKHWTCVRVEGGVPCGHHNPSRKKKCEQCGKLRPRKRRPLHGRVLLERPHEWWAERFGETCNICGAEPGTRRLHRDHDHRTGAARGVLCFRCNTALPNRVDAAWLRAAAEV
jgi:hypothetical protein